MKRTLLLIAGLLAAVTLLAACGGDDDKSAATNTPAGTSATNSGGGSSATEVATATPENEETAEPTEDTNNDDAIDACALLTTSEIEEAIQEDVTDGVLDTTNPTKPICTWGPAEETNTLDVELSVLSPALEGGAEADYDLLDEGSEQLDGLGDRAHWLGNLHTLEVLTGNRNVGIFIITFNDTDEKAAAITLAEKALERLPD